MTLARTPFPRKKPEAVSGLPFATKPRACRHCGKEFVPAKPMVALCGPKCAYREVMAKEAARKAAERAERKADKERLADLDRIPKLIALAQTAFNAFIRARDAGKPCICCGKPFEPTKPGGSVDAGHYLARGGNTHLRFNEDNCFAQRKNCNRPGGATRADFRAGVLARIGLERLEAVENGYHVHKWTREELIAIKETYRAKLRTLAASAAQPLEN